MSDTSNTLQIKNAQLASIDEDGDSITLHFSMVHLIQDMEGAIEDSLWTQAINIKLMNYTLDGNLPDCPCEVTTGDFIDNIFTYRDHAPLPIDWRGETGCKLTTTGGDEPFSIEAEFMQVEQIDMPHYIKHVKKT